VRPDSARRHTLENLLDSGAYTLNHVTAETFRQAHQCSARYPAEVSEFEATGLAPHWEPGFQAPFVQEARIRLAMSLQERHDLAINGTILIIGRIEQAWLPEDCLGPDGFVDLEQAGTVASSGLDSYHLTQRLGRLPYAKP
jgi:flavin reductase (DIM6/NTAB) family NADH-FMN oxidoreductase RutF